jgi:hypothetical protein
MKSTEELRNLALDLRVNIGNLDDLRQVMSVLIPGIQFERDNNNQVILYTGLRAQCYDGAKGDLYFQALINEGFSTDYAQYTHKK